jgi:hypothetical protein
MRFSVLLTFVTAAAAAVLPRAEGETAEGKTAVSPDGYTYTVEARAYVPDTVTLDDGTNATVHIHPDFEFVRRDGTTPHKADKRGVPWEAGGRDQCGPSGFKGKTSGASPTTVDCKAIMTYYEKANGRFVARSNMDFNINGDWCRLVTAASCVFGIKSKNQLNPMVGGSDIADVTRDAMNRYKSRGSPSRIGAEGNMGCNHSILNGLGGKASVDWAIFRK